jgi:hypothetical protein
LLRNNKITNDFFSNLSSMAMNLKRLEICGKPNEFQHKISYDGIENFCNFTSGRIQALRFEYSIKIGQENIAKIA